MMTKVFNVVQWVFRFLVVLLLTQLTGPVLSARAQSQPVQAVVHAVQGAATWRVGATWQPLQENHLLGAGATIKTADNTTVDLFLPESGTVLRLLPNSEVRFDRMDEMPGGERPITTTRLTLLAGSLIGSQRKLLGASQFHINLAHGLARIVGTEYLVRADGSVSCLSGEVTVRYNLPGNGGSVKADVPAGFSFDSATGKVVPTTPAYLQNIIADVVAVRKNAQVFKIGRATLVVNATEKPVSPTHPEHPPHPPHPPHPEHPPHPGDDGGDGGLATNVH